MSRYSRQTLLAVDDWKVVKVTAPSGNSWYAIEGVDGNGAMTFRSSLPLREQDVAELFKEHGKVWEVR